jgi:hypothetical protein
VQECVEVRLSEIVQERVTILKHQVLPISETVQECVEDLLSGIVQASVMDQMSEIVGVSVITLRHLTRHIYEIVWESVMMLLLDLSMLGTVLACVEVLL